MISVLTFVKTSMHITVVGKVSTGKSSFINSFYKILADHYYIEWQPICTMSIQRETFQPTRFILGNKSEGINYEQDLKKNREILRSCMNGDNRNTPKKFEFRTVNIKPECVVKTITDFPGFDDSNDDRDCLGLILENMGNVTIFITDAYRPFVDKSELEYYEKIRNRSAELNKTGHFHLLLTICNKFDYMDDIDLNEMHGNLKIKTFRWCPYAVFREMRCVAIKNIIQKARAVLSPADPDGFFEYLIRLPVAENIYKVGLEFAISELEKGKIIDAEPYNDPVVNRLVLKNFITRGGFRLPDRCFSEDTLKNIYATEKVPFQTFTESMTYIFENFTVADPSYFRQFLRYNFANINFKNTELAALKKWSKFKYWQLYESFRGHGLLDLPVFPAAEIKWLKLDLMQILENCHLNPGRAVNFGVYF